MAQVTKIDNTTKTVTFEDGTTLTYNEFLEDLWHPFWEKRIAGETLDFSSIEHFMKRGNAKTSHQLMKAKKLEGFFEGQSDKMLTKGQKVALAGAGTFIILAAFAVVILKSQGVF